MRHVYAIVRSNDFLADRDISSRVTVKKIVYALETAESEVKRLNELSAGKDYHYFWQLTRLEECSEEQTPSSGAEDR